jgi:asparagine synthetase B (glutamine-hydrolysing)
VEGRTPLADATLAALAESLPIGEKFEPVSASGVGVAAPASRRTKIALRRAFEADVPPRALTRAKESFPLPFERWLTPACAALRESPFARSAFTPAAVASVTARPEAAWHLLWPMANVALWADRWGWASA